MAVVDFIEVLGTWIEKSTLKRLRKTMFFSVMADECTDISTVEELSLFCRWEEGGVPIESFLEIMPLQKADAVSIYTTLVKCLKDKNLQVGNIIGMGFDGAATFSGRKTGVQARLKNHAPHALFVHRHCHMLQLACVQAANSTTGIKHVYTTLTTMWKYFKYSPKRTQFLKDIQQVLELPELKVIKPSDTRWLAHERCVKAVKASYTSLVVTFESNYQNLHEPEALGLHKTLTKFNTIAAIYLLDYVLPNIAKLSKTLQKEQLDLSMISSLVDSVLESLEDAITPVANWVLELMDAKDELEKVTGQTINPEKIERFQANIGSPFIACIETNISNRFASHEIVSAMSIFDPRKVPSTERSFSQMKLIKTRLRNSLTDIRLSHLMKIAIESPESLSDNDLEAVLNIWNIKPRRLSI